MAFSPFFGKKGCEPLRGSQPSAYKGRGLLTEEGTVVVRSQPSACADGNCTSSGMLSRMLVPLPSGTLVLRGSAYDFVFL